VRAVPERELLAQARRLESEAQRGEAFHRVAYADWCLCEGLVPEALSALDRVLAADPDQEQALALLAREDLPLSLPTRAPRSGGDALQELCSLGAHAGPAYRELAVRALARLEEPEVAARLEGELVHRDPTRRSFAALALRRLAPGAGLEPLLSRAILDRSEEVRVGASLALRDARQESVIGPALRALGSSHPTVRNNAIQALGHMAYPAAVEPLVGHLTSLQAGGSNRAPRSHVYFGTQQAYIQDYDVEVAQSSSIADPIINILQEGVVLDAAVIGVTETVVATERAQTRRALARLTGADPGSTSAAWFTWWQENGAAWKAGADARGPAAPRSPGG
jgi:HEAT repeat protein